MRLALRIVAGIALAILIAMAFHYAKKYESNMLTDPGSEFNCSIANGPVVCK
jgi:hypothetical protein